MRDDKDNLTAEIPGVKPIKVRAPRPKKYASDAEKQAAYRARKGVTALTIMLPTDVHAAFAEWLTAKGRKPSAVIAKLIQSQLLRPR